jgi:hypothetical protein
MRLPLLASLALAAGLCALSAHAASGANPDIVSLGHDTYALTRWADNGFTRNTAKLKEQALQDAAAYCARLHRELKVVSTTASRPLVPLTGFASAKVVFRALEADDPALQAPADAPVSSAVPVTAAAPAPKSATDTLYSDLLKLDDLRKRGILTEEEFEVLKKHLLDKAK